MPGDGQRRWRLWPLVAMAYTSNLAFGCVPTGVHGVGRARIELTWGPDNDGSQRDAACCGFVREGVMRSHPPFKAAGGTP